MDKSKSAMPPQRFLSIKKVADELGVSTRTVSRWIETGDLVAHKFGRLVRVGEIDLQRFLATRRGL
jgi:excisionase family DNA binding protein